MQKCFPMLALAALLFAPLSKAEQVSPVRSAAIHTCNDEAANPLLATCGRLHSLRSMERAWQSTVSALTSNPNDRR